MATSTKKRKRSSLALNRIELDFSPGVGKGLHRQIDTTLPTEQRLQQLIKLCLKSAVDRVSPDVENQDVKDQLESVLTEAPLVLERQDVKEALLNACQKESLIPNPANLEMDNTVAEMEARIAGLLQEERDWIQYMEDLDTQTQQAVSQVAEKVIQSSCLSPTQTSLAGEYLPEMVDLAVVQQQVEDNVDKAAILVCQHQAIVHRLDQAQTEVNSKLDKALLQLHSNTFGHNLGSPKRNIENLMEFPTPPAEPAI